MARSQQTSVLGFALLIGGSAVGAGILGLPVKAGLAGLGPALLGMIVMYAACLVTAWVIADAHLRGGDPEADLSTIYRRELGAWGRWLCLAGYLINYYGILVAYLAGACSVLNALLGLGPDNKLTLLAFFGFSTAACLFGSRLLVRLNALIMVLLFLSFGIFLAFTLDIFEPANLAHVDWDYLPATMPVITCSLVYHNLVPLACRSLGGDRRRIFLALLCGSAIPLVFGALCLVAVVGALPLAGDSGSLLSAFHADQPATIPLTELIASPWFKLSGMVFSLLAIFTSYIGVGAGLMGFWRDLGKKILKKDSGLVKPTIVFLPSLLVVLVWPNLFLSALDLVGGLGLGLFVGLGPALILLLRRPKGWIMVRTVGLSLLLLFGFIICLELGQEGGLVHIRPHMEYWTPYQPR